MSSPKERIDVLVVDDEESMREFLEVVIDNEGLNVRTVGSGEEAVELVKTCAPRAMIQDLRMGGLDGMDLLEQVKSIAPEMPVVIMTAYSTWDTAVEAMRLGAFDYLKKPFDTEHVRAVLQRAIQVSAVETDPDAVRRLIVGNTHAMHRVYELIKKVAPTDSTVLIRGESGSGKEVVARSIHAASHRAHMPFTAVNCSAFTETLLESELFGHARGAFTGAMENRKGLFETANGGTLFLDEVAEMSLTTQVKILRVLEERRVLPVGGNTEIPVDVRIVAATNRDIEKEIQEGNFREDLFFRLNVIPVHLPSLRERKEDIPLLSGHFLARYSAAMGRPVKRLSKEAQEDLLEYDWPGNVRELENVIQRYVALCDGETIGHVDLKTSGGAPAPMAESFSIDEFDASQEGFILDDVMEEIERRFLVRALEQTGGNLTQAAKLLGMSYRSIRYKVKKLKVRSLLTQGE